MTSSSIGRRMARLAAVAAVCACVAWQPGTADGQVTGAAAGQAGTQSVPAAPATPESNWITNCSSASRQGEPECSVQQSIVKTDTQQIVVLFSVRIPSETRSPVMLIQLPLGLFLPAGITLQTDEAEPISLPVQTCDGAGCYASGPVSDELLDRLRLGTMLFVSFQNLSRARVDVSMPLARFAAAYDAVK